MCDDLNETMVYFKCNGRVINFLQDNKVSVYLSSCVLPVLISASIVMEKHK